jgi:hypothetical protein
MLYGDGYVDKNTKPTVDNSKLEKYFQEHDIGQKIEAALNSVLHKDILPEHPMLAIAEALVPGLRGDKVYVEKMKTERHDNMIRLNQLAAEYKDMKKTLADDNEAMHSMIAEKNERLNRGLAKIPECAICMDQGPFSWIYKGCRHISVCDACHESGQVKQCPMHDVKQKFDKVEKVYFAFGK